MPNMLVFRVWDEAEVPGENLHRHRETVQTPHGKTQAEFELSTLLLQGNSA